MSIRRTVAAMTDLIERRVVVDQGQFDTALDESIDHEMDLARMAGDPISAEQAERSIYDRFPQLWTLRENLPKAAFPAPVVEKADQRPARQAVYDRIDRAVDNLMPSVAQLTNPRERAIRRTALYSEFVCKNSLGRVLYALSESLGPTETVSDVSKRSARLGVEIRKCL